MAKRTPAQVYAALRAAGASDDAARILTEIAGAESGDNDTALGDVKLENGTWGPSYGAFQIRTVKGDTGKGTDRDISYLAGGLPAQAAAALKISSNGTDFTPWTTFNNGSYLGQATNVNADIGAPAAGSPTSVSTAGLSIPGVSGVLGDVRSLVIEAGFALLGLALIGVAVAHLAGPAVESAGKTAGKAAVLL